jgi:hypothetical protein
MSFKMKLGYRIAAREGAVWHVWIRGLAWLALALMLARAVSFWASDPLLGYANNWDQIRATGVFGLKPRDSDQPIGAATIEQPWRFYIKAAPMDKPIYPSSDLLVKGVQVGAMAVFSRPGGIMDVKVAGAALLLGWIAGVLWVFTRLLARPVAALGFSLWCCAVADPINLLFLNTLYAEFTAIVAATLLVGVLWLWLEERLSSRRTLWVGIMLVLFLALHRNQWAYLGLVLLPVALALAWQGRRKQGPPRLRSVFGWVLVAVVVCAVPMEMFRSTHMLRTLLVSVNRIDTVMGTLLPASQDPRGMLRVMKLPDSCLAMSGKNVYTAPTDEFVAKCPPISHLSLARVGRALMAQPQVMVPIVRYIATERRGFLDFRFGQVEGRRFGRITDLDGLSSVSVNSVITWLTPAWTEALIWLLIAGPVALTVVLLAMRTPRWAVMFAAQGLLFNYVLFSAILGDGYADLERHAMLCFSFGALLPILLLTGACSRLLERRLRVESKTVKP